MDEPFGFTEFREPRAALHRLAGSRTKERPKQHTSSTLLKIKVNSLYTQNRRLADLFANYFH
jgi:hypothetical protein